MMPQGSQRRIGRHDQACSDVATVRGARCFAVPHFWNKGRPKRGFYFAVLIEVRFVEPSSRSSATFFAFRRICE